MVKTRIRELRLAKGVGQKYLADHLGVSVSSVSCWERSEKIPRGSKLPMLAQLLGCTIDDLFKKEK